MCPALQSYFSLLTAERQLQLKERIKNFDLVVVMDNAHIPLGDCYGINVKDDNDTQRTTRSLSALDKLSFPQEFPSRWDSIECQARTRTEADFVLQKPSRSRDEFYDGHEEQGAPQQWLDRTLHIRQNSPIPKKRTKRLMKNYPGGKAFRSYSTPPPSSSLDSRTRCLRELPQLDVRDSGSAGLHYRIEANKDTSAKISLDSTPKTLTEDDFGLQKPSRSRDEFYDGHEEQGAPQQWLDRTLHIRQNSPIPKKRTKRLMKNYPGGKAFRSYSTPPPSSSLDSRTRCLRELPQLDVRDSGSAGLHYRIEANEDKGAKIYLDCTPKTLTADDISTTSLRKKVLISVGE